ncbi:MAG TPA: hypothetical protein VL463_16465 [Kofleriaceae bacterium]|nr:hypothetical protein [Kofleriaceae bacterium]
MGGCTNCKGKSGCDHRKGEMLEAVADALDRLYPTQTWGERADTSTAPDLEEIAALADELATELDAATFVVPGGPDAACDYIYVLAIGRPPCAVQVRDQGVPAPAEWEGGLGSISETYLRVCISHVARFAAVQEIAIDVGADAGGFVIRERPRAGVYSAPLLRRMQRLVAILPAYDLRHLDFGEISAPPPSFRGGSYAARFGAEPATANYLFFSEPATMVTTSWLPREAGARAC